MALFVKKTQFNNGDTVLYNNQRCKILYVFETPNRIDENYKSIEYFDLETLEKTEKGIIETFLSVRCDKVILPFETLLEPHQKEFTKISFDKLRFYELTYYLENQYNDGWKFLSFIDGDLVFEKITDLYPNKSVNDYQTNKELKQYLVLSKEKQSVLAKLNYGLKNIDNKYDVSLVINDVINYISGLKASDEETCTWIAADYGSLGCQDILYDTSCKKQFPADEVHKIADFKTNFKYCPSCGKKII